MLPVHVHPAWADHCNQAHHCIAQKLCHMSAVPPLQHQAASRLHRLSVQTCSKLRRLTYCTSSLVPHFANQDLHLQQAQECLQGRNSIRSPTEILDAWRPDKLVESLSLQLPTSFMGPLSGFLLRCTTTPLSALLMKWALPLMSYMVGGSPFQSRIWRGWATNQTCTS